MAILESVKNVKKTKILSPKAPVYHKFEHEPILVAKLVTILDETESQDLVEAINVVLIQ